MAIKSFEIVSVPVSDQQRSKEFYRDVVGFELLREDPMGPGQSWIQLAPRVHPAGRTKKERAEARSL
jgi:catechol 2,3-dioxygenase-like lactoylglutathione lyase family enzyme